jgi:hypothetical protein
VKEENTYSAGFTEVCLFLLGGGISGFDEGSLD